MRTTRVLAATATLAASLSLSAGTAYATPVTPVTPVTPHAEQPCRNGESWPTIGATWAAFDDAGAKVVRGGAPVEGTLVIKNTSGHEVRNFSSMVQITSPEVNAVVRFDVQVKLPGGDWEPVTYGSETHLGLYFRLAPIQIAKDASASIQFRIAAPKTIAAPYDYQFQFSGHSDYLDNDTGAWLATLPSEAFHAKQPGGPGTCTSYTASDLGHIAVIDTPPTPSGTPTPTPTATPTATATATATATVTTTTTATTQAAATPELASTGGGSNALPVALTGAASVALGAGILAFSRRRGSHG